MTSTLRKPWLESKQPAMPDWTDVEAEACRRLVQLALDEDLEAAGDLTSNALLPAEAQGAAAIVARAEGILAGLPAARLVYATVQPDLSIECMVQDGQKLSQRTVVATVRGSTRAILAGERTCLNFLQRLSGIATMTRRYVDAVAGLPCRILDTRKTTPGWRRLEKYAVRCGGGFNHRMGLFDGILIKDNHLAAVERGRPARSGGRDGRAPAIARAVRAARQHASGMPVEVEVDTLAQLGEALAARPDRILLDNMDPATLREAVRRRNEVAPEITLEASGGITLSNVRAVAETGVDFISVGALTHSAPALDLALDYQF